MTSIASIASGKAASSDMEARGPLSPAARRTVLLLVLGAGVAAGLLATRPDAAAAAVAQAGADLTRLLRAMALLKAVMAAAMAAAVLWRLGSAATWLWMAAYGVACAAMACGPGLIWDMDQVRLGALLLHGGLLATLILLWRDPAVATRLSALVAARRTALRQRQSTG